MRFQSGITDQYIYFVAVDSTDLKTRETGLSSFTVYRSRNGGAATAYTTPTVAELSAANMPGVYSLLLDEDMTIDSGDDSQAVVLHITQASMAPVTLMYELYRPTVTAGGTLTVTSGRANADVTHIATAAVSTSTAQLGVNVVNFGGSAGTFASGRPEVNTSHIAGSAVSTSSAQIGVNVVNAAGTAWGSGAITAASIATGAITNVKFAAGAIDAAAIAADAIGASELAADAATEIATAVWASGTRTVSAATNITSTGGTIPITAGSLVSADVTAISTDTTAANNAESFFDGTGYAGTNNVIPTVTTVTTATNVTTVNGLAANVITAASIAADASAEIADAVWDEDATGHQTTGTFGQAIGDPGANTETLYKAIVTDPAGTNIAADIIAIKAETASILTDTAEIGAAGAGLTAVPWNAAWDAEVQSEVDDALVAQNLDHLVKSAVDTDFATTVHANSVVGHLADNGAGFDRTTDSLEAIRDRGDAAWITATGFSTHSAADVWAAGTRTLTAIDEDSTTLDLDATIRVAVGLASANLDTQLDALPTAAENADAVWEEAIADHSGTSGSTAEALNAAGAAGDPWTTALPGAYGAGSAGYIVGDNLNATVSSRASQTSVDTVDDFLDTEIAAIKAKTDNLPSDPADASDIAARFTTLDTAVATVDTVVDAIKVKTDSLTFTVAGQVDANIQYVNDVQVTGTGAAGDEWGP